MFRCPLPSTGSLGSVPPLPRYCKALRLPAAPPALLRFLASRYRHAPWTSLPQPQDATAAGLGLFTGIPKTGFLDGDDRTSQVPGGPRYERALLFDPGGTAALGHCRALVLSSAIWTASTPATFRISGLNHTARALAVYASQGGLLHRHARLASGGWPTLPGGTGYPPGPIERFQVIPSSFPRLRLAHPNSGERSTPDNWENDRGRGTTVTTLLNWTAQNAEFSYNPLIWAIGKTIH